MKILKLEILAAPLTSNSIFLGAPPLLLVLKYTNFQSPPFGCLKIFGAPPQYLHHPLVPETPTLPASRNGAGNAVQHC